MEFDYLAKRRLLAAINLENEEIEELGEEKELEKSEEKTTQIKDNKIE